MLTYAAGGVQGKSTPAAHSRNPEDRKARVGENTFSENTFSTVPPWQFGCSTANTRNQDDGRVFFFLNQKSCDVLHLLLKTSIGAWRVSLLLFFIFFTISKCAGLFFQFQTWNPIWMCPHLGSKAALVLRSAELHWIWLYIYIYIYSHTHTYIYIYIYIHTYIHTYTLCVCVCANMHCGSVDAASSKEEHKATALDTWLLYCVSSHTY